MSFPDGTLRLGFKVTAAGSVFEIQRITTDAEGQEGGPMAAAEAASRSVVLVRSRGRARCLE